MAWRESKNPYGAVYPFSVVSLAWRSLVAPSSGYCHFWSKPITYHSCHGGGGYSSPSSIACWQSSGADGFPTFFWGDYWYLINKETIQGVLYFSETSKMTLTWKQSFIVLILKMSHPIYDSDFWPLNLCNTIYKLVATILYHFKPLIPHLMSLA